MKLVIGVLFRMHKFLDVDTRIEVHVYNAYYHVFAVEVQPEVLEQYCKTNTKSTRQVFSECRSMKGKPSHFCVILQTVYVSFGGRLRSYIADRGEGIMAAPFTGEKRYFGDVKAVRQRVQIFGTD